MTVTLDHGEADCLIHLDGEINIASAAELKTLLVEALATGKDLRVDLERATQLDITALQLLWAAERKAAGAGSQFTVAGSVPQELADATADAGFEKFPVPGGQK